MIPKAMKTPRHFILAGFAGSKEAGKKQKIVSKFGANANISMQPANKVSPTKYWEISSWAKSTYYNSSLVT